MSLIDIITQGLTGGALGAIGGIAEKVIMTRMENSQTRAEWEHIKDMHLLQQKAEERIAQQQLSIRETEGEYVGLAESIKHDVSLKFDNVEELLKTHPRIGAFVVILQTMVNTVRSLFRPFLTVYLIQLATVDEVFVPLASAAVFWWIGSRGTAAAQRHIQ